MSITIENNIENNIIEIKRKIAEAAVSVKRNPNEITLMAVSKTKPLEEARQAARCGAQLGENYVQEFTEKYEQAPELPWHFIGHLQTNKVKYIVGRAKMIHSVDSLHLAEKINSESKKRSVITDCLIEINSGNEESKFGLTFSESLYTIKEIAELENVSVRGLMTVAPICASANDNICVFRKMKELFDILKKEIPSVDTLSMGMSSDFEAAVREGATIVRVGTKIFGERNYKK